MSAARTACARHGLVADRRINDDVGEYRDSTLELLLHRRTQPMMKNSLAKRFLSLVLLAASAGLVLGAVYAFRRNCEGFGCPNATGLWSAWAGIYALIAACGLRLRAGLLPGTSTRKLVTVSLVVLAVLGVALVGYWVLEHNAA